ncbi:hypothetical protein BGP_6325 [Beggiatoa sp. PS]|nr:hypothetical protein BGP_6325 [Beggiatoa sp. PS]
MVWSPKFILEKDSLGMRIKWFDKLTNKNAKVET